MSDIDKVKIGSYIKILPGFAFDSSYFTDTNQGMPLIRIRDLENEVTDAWFTGSYDEKYIIHKDDILVGMDGDFLVAKWKGDNSLLNQRVCKLETIDHRTLNQEFLYYSLIDEIKKIHQVTSATTVKHLSTKNIQNLEIWLPKQVEEQAKIAEVLATIDRAIAQTEALIAKHQRIKTGLMQDLLTRGIDEHGQLRDPSTHRFKSTPLGMIPVEWEVNQINQMRRKDRPYIKTGPFGSALKSEHWVSEGVPVITIGALGEGYFINEELLHISKSKADSLQAYSVVDGDIVFSRVADVGRSVVVSEKEHDWIISSNLIRISVDKSIILPEFLQMNISSNMWTKKQIRQSVNAGGRDVANTPILEKLNFILPDIEEQKRIVDAVMAQAIIISNEKIALSKLLKVKAGLMQDLLSGRVSVKPLME